MITPEPPPPRRWWIPPMILLAGIAAGASLGIVTNAVNGRVSPVYFAIVLDVQSEIERSAIDHGIVEGGAFGAVFGLVVAISYAASTRLRGTFALACKTLGLAIAVVTACWAAGGLAGVAIASTRPSWFANRFTFGILANDAYELRKFAWVGGSIWGAYAGAALAVITSCTWQHLKWRRLRQGESPRFEVIVREPPAIVTRSDIR